MLEYHMAQSILRHWLWQYRGVLLARSMIQIKFKNQLWI
jgi:hypothetical protein